MIASARVVAAEEAETKAAGAALAEALKTTDFAEPEQRAAFIAEHGPSSVPLPEPPCPPKGPMGDKTPELMEWMAEYRPAEFIARYQNSGGNLVKQLLNQARACLNQ